MEMGYQKSIIVGRIYYEVTYVQIIISRAKNKMKCESGWDRAERREADDTGFHARRD